MAIKDVYKQLGDRLPDVSKRKVEVFEQAVGNFVNDCVSSGITDADKFVQSGYHYIGFLQKHLTEFEAATKLTVHRGLIMTLVHKASLPPEPVPGPGGVLP